MNRGSENTGEFPNYVPLGGKQEKLNWKQKIQRCFSNVSEKLQSFWPFFWRWLLLYIPFWGLLLWMYFKFSAAS